MTAVNLNKYRKAKRRQEKQAEATANRAKHGRTKAEKARDAAVEEQRRQLLDGAKKDEA